MLMMKAMIPHLGKVPKQGYRLVFALDSEVAAVENFLIILRRFLGYL